MMARSILQIVSRPGRIVAGSIRFARDGRPARRHRAASTPRARRSAPSAAADIAMIFQEPMNSLSPVHSIGNQLVEKILLHHRVGRQAAVDRAAQALGPGRHSRSAPPPVQLSVRAVGRHAPAGDDRDGAGLPPGAADRRRADHRARRHHPGQHPRADQSNCKARRAWPSCSSPTISASSPRSPMRWR